MKQVGLSLSVVLALLVSVPVWSQQWQAQSPSSVVAVLELFTAEGCGLCPAAHQFVDTLPEHGMTDENLIVLGFHVDYLDARKGWTDPFAKPAFTERQNQLAILNRYQHVYTPEFVLSGETVHSWRAQLIEVIQFLNDYTAEADIILTAQKQTGRLTVQSAVQVRGEANQRHSKLYLALKEADVRSHIQGGDNDGLTLSYPHLVREWAGPFELDIDGYSMIEHQFALSADWQTENLTVVALVQNLSDGYVLQGVALPLTESRQ